MLSTRLLRSTSTATGVMARARAERSPAGRPKLRYQHGEEPHGQDSGDGLGMEQAEAAKAEELDAGSLDPEGDRRFVDRDEGAGVEGDEEKVAPTLRHALYRLSRNRHCRVQYRRAERRSEQQDGAKGNAVPRGYHDHWAHQGWLPHGGKGFGGHAHSSRWGMAGRTPDVFCPAATRAQAWLTVDAI